MSTTAALDREACETLLKPHLPALEACFRAAWQRWQKWIAHLDGSPADISPRTRANALYDLIVAEAKRRFLGADHVTARLERGFLVLHFHDRVALRFKKFQGKSLRTSANKTKQTELFDSQKLFFPESQLSPMTHLIAGYLLNSLAIDFERLALTCSVGGDHLWAPIELTRTAAPVVDLTARQSAKAPKARKSVARSSRTSKRKKTEGKDDKP